MWDEQKNIFKNFIRTLESLMVKWVKGGYFPIHKTILDELADYANLLMKMDEKLNLTEQKEYTDELMAFLTMNITKSLSPQIEKRIKELKTKIEEEQNKI